MTNSGQIWPQDLVAYKRTPQFDQHTVPAGLLRAHATKSGVWAKIHVMSGHLLFRDLTDGRETLLEPGIHPVIYPEARHEVAPTEGTAFFVEFHHRPAPM